MATCIGHVPFTTEVALNRCGASRLHHGQRSKQSDFSGLRKLACETFGTKARDLQRAATGVGHHQGLSYQSCVCGVRNRARMVSEQRCMDDGFFRRGYS